jgi:hypothetical protein
MSKYKHIVKREPLNKVEEVDEETITSGAKVIRTRDGPINRFGKFPTQYASKVSFNDAYSSSPNKLYYEKEIDTTPYARPFSTYDIRSTYNKPQDFEYTENGLNDALIIEHISAHYIQQVLNLLRKDNVLKDYIEDKDCIIIQLNNEADIREYFEMVKQYLENQFENKAIINLMKFPEKHNSIEDKESVKTPSLNYLSKLLDTLLSW